MSKAEKFKKIYKKVLNWVVPIVIISVVIGAILVIPKYYNKSRGTIETPQLTVSPSYNWEILATSILGGFFVAILILVLVLNSRRKSKSGVVKPKMSYGGVWNWIIALVIISAIIGAVFIVPKNIKKGWNGIGISELSIPATVIWKKKPHQYGSNPEKRTSGYMNATVTEDNDDKFCFTVHVNRNEDSHYYGRKVEGGRIEGSWRNPPNGGNWHLEKDEHNPKLYNGEISDIDLPDWAYLQLELLN